MHTILTAILIGIFTMTAGAAPVTVERTEGNLTLAASVSKRAFAPGEPVGIHFTVRNAAAGALGVMFTSGQRFDVIVRRSRGDEVWRWSHDKAFIQVIQTATLLPQEALSFSVSWDQRDFQGRRVDPGTYDLIAVFMGRLNDKASIALPPIGITIAGK